MRKSSIATVVFAFFSFVVLTAALAPQLPQTLYNYAAITLPDHFLVNALPGPGNAVVANDNTPLNNPVTDEGATLGRVLFYDKNLSQNRTIACASCHHQQFGFSDTAVLSLGFNGGTTRRHSMRLGNARFYDRGHFFWDERAATLEDQVLMPFQDPVEMGMTLQEVVSRVQAESYYPDLFIDAFGDTAVTAARISRSLSQFVRSMVTYSSKYDEGRAMISDPTQPFPNFTNQENMGKNLFFMASPGRPVCAGCHNTEAFINPPGGPLNNGLDAVSTTDLGAFETDSLPQSHGAFKVPSLRNIGIAPPYMHDGRFATLDEVIDHYSTGIQDHVNLAQALRTPGGNPVQYNFTFGQKQALIAFLHTLTDNAFTQDEKFSNPFVETTGVADVQVEELSVYPNPAEDYLNLSFNLPESGMVRVDLLNTSGQTVKILFHQFKDAGHFGTQVQLDDNTIAAGTYILYIQTKRGYSTRKIVKI